MFKKKEAVNHSYHSYYPYLSKKNNENVIVLAFLS